MPGSSYIPSVFVQNVPSDFQRLDTLVTEARTFVDVYTLRRTRDNINALIAKRARNVCVSDAFVSAEAGTYEEFVAIYPVVAGAPHPDYLGDWQFWSAPRHHTYRLTIEASSSKAAGTDVFVYPVLGCEGMGMQAPSTDKMLTVSGTTPTLYDIDIYFPLPATPVGPRRGSLRLYFMCEYSGTADATGDVLEYGTNWIRVATQRSVGDVVWITTATSIEHRLIVAVEPVAVDAATNYILYVDKPWNVASFGSEENYGLVTPAKLRLRTLSLQPLRMTSVESTVDTF